MIVLLSHDEVNLADQFECHIVLLRVHVCSFTNMQCECVAC